MRTATVLVLLALAVVVQADNPVATISKEKDLSLFAKLVDFADAKTALSDPKAKVTLLAPTDEAVKAFLKDMGLTPEDLSKMPALVDAILAYHIVLGAAAGPKELFAEKDTVSVPTADLGYSLTFKKAGDKVTVTDEQGNVATVTKADLRAGGHAVHKIDKVLFSGTYFKSLGALVKTVPIFSTLVALADKAGLAGTLSDAAFSDTVFVPTNAAFAKAGISADSADKAVVTDVLKYHVVPGYKLIPGGFESGKPVETLLGQTITVTYEEESKIDGIPTKRAFVTDASGSKAMIIKPNLFFGKSVAQVIDGVLMPKMEAAEEPAVEAEAKPETKPAVEEPAVEEPAVEEPAVEEPAVEEPAMEEPAMEEPAMEEPAMEEPAVEAEPEAKPAEQPAPAAKPAATPAAAAATKTIKIAHPHGSFTLVLPSFSFSKGFGRKMLQTESTANTYGPTIATDSTAQAILAAVNDGASLGATMGAGMAGVANSQVLTLFPVHSSYADGLIGQNLADAASGGN